MRLKFVAVYCLWLMLLFVGVGCESSTGDPAQDALGDDIQSNDRLDAGRGNQVDAHSEGDDSAGEGDWTDLNSGGDDASGDDLSDDDASASDGASSDEEVFNHQETPSYAWNLMDIGGGGYVTGLAIHPQDKDIRYIRTDVGGAYRWDAAQQKWEQLLNWIGPENENLIGVDGLALDPNNPDRVYLALGKKLNGIGGLYRSEDRGESWELLKEASFEGNGRRDRWTGECVAIDPQDSQKIYMGTRTDGLWRSVDDGENWQKVDAIPDGETGTNPIGVRSILFDEDGASPHLYIGVPGQGVYISRDGGQQYAHLDGSPVHPNRMQPVQGKLVVTHDQGVALYSRAENRWRDISPQPQKNYVALAVDKNNPDKMIAAQRSGAFFNLIFRSTNGGSTWQEIKRTEYIDLHVSVPWWNQQRFSSATAAMAFIPDQPDEILYTDWFGVWRCTDIWSTDIDCYTDIKGHEETVVLTLVSPPEGAWVYSGMADNFGFKHTSEAYPEDRLYDLNEGFSIAFSEQSPNHLAVLGATGWDGENTTLAVSDDFGEGWATRELPAGAMLGRISISSTDPDNLIYIAGGGRVYYSLDNANSWAESQEVPQNTVEKTDIWNKSFIIAPDTINHSFYLYHRGDFYVSTDAGASWQVVNQNSPLPNKATGYINVAPAPGVESEVWVSLDAHGLWRSADAGQTFEKVEFFEAARTFTWGQAHTTNAFPTAYCYGKVAGKWGLYRSTNQGTDWLRINDDQHQFLGSVKTIAADRNTFGRVFVGTGGSGVFYGEID